jgi:hypothetical protein
LELIVILYSSGFLDLHAAPTDARMEQIGCRFIGPGE